MVSPLCKSNSVHPTDQDWFVIGVISSYSPFFLSFIPCPSFPLVFVSFPVKSSCFQFQFPLICLFFFHYLVWHSFDLSICLFNCVLFFLVFLSFPVRLSFSVRFLLCPLVFCACPAYSFRFCSSLWIQRANISLRLVGKIKIFASVSAATMEVPRYVRFRLVFIISIYWFSYPFRFRKSTGLQKQLHTSKGEMWEKHK